MSDAQALAALFSGIEAFLGRLEGVLPRAANLPASELGAVESGDVGVVPNSSALLGAGLGADVDANAAMVRFNSYKTEGFEADVGGKVTIYFFNECCLNETDLSSYQGAPMTVWSGRTGYSDDFAAPLVGRMYVIYADVVRSLTEDYEAVAGFAPEGNVPDPRKRVFILRWVDARISASMRACVRKRAFPRVHVPPPFAEVHAADSSHLYDTQASPLPAPAPGSCELLMTTGYSGMLFVLSSCERVRAAEGASRDAAGGAGRWAGAPRVPTMHGFRDDERFADGAIRGEGMAGSSSSS